jgi:hypothetical protein
MIETLGEGIYEIEERPNDSEKMNEAGVKCEKHVPPFLLRLQRLAVRLGQGEGVVGRRCRTGLQQGHLMDVAGDYMQPARGDNNLD